jgi:signal transduction histidine kinase
VSGQSSKEIDSLKKVIITQKENVLKVDNLVELAFLYRKIDPKKAIKAAEQALLLSNHLNYHKGRADAENRLGIAYLRLYEFDTALTHFTREFEISNTHNYEHGVGRSINQLSKMYLKKGDYDEALQYAFKAKEIYIENNDEGNLGLIFNHIGNIYDEKADYGKAIEMYLESVSIRSKLNDDEALGYSYNSLGFIYKKIEVYPKSLEYYNLALEAFTRAENDVEIKTIYNNLGNLYADMDDYENAFSCFNNALKIMEELDVLQKDPSIYNNLGVLYYEVGDTINASKNYQKSLEISHKLEDQQGIMDANINLGTIHFNKKEYSKAIEKYKISLRIASDRKSVQDQMKVLKKLMLVHSEQKNIEIAFRYAQQYIEIDENIDEELQEAYKRLSNYEEKRKQNALLKKDNEIATAKNKEQKTYIISLIVGLILLMLLFFAIFRVYKQRQRTVLAEKNKELEKQKSQEKLKQQEIDFINKMLEQQEQEQQRIAEDLHDRVGSLLSLVKIQLDALKKSSKKMSKEVEYKFKKTNDTVDETCDEVRKIAYNMSSSVLSKFGLIAALEDLKEAIEEASTIEIEFVTHGFHDRLHDDLETVIYKVIQELLNNVIKHADASEITLQLIQSKEKINITLEDNGIGFNADLEDETTNGMGLKNVVSRIYKINGEVFMDSVLQKGTTITIDIPLNI